MEETPGFFLCLLFTLQSIATWDWAGLLSALVPLRGCQSHLACWDNALQPPQASGNLAMFSDLDVCSHQGFAEVISLVADGSLSMAVFPSYSAWDPWDSNIPHSGPGHPEAPP